MNSNSFYADIDKKYNLIKRIGSGGTSKVYLATAVNNPTQCFAVKVIKSSSSTDSKFFNNEVNMLKQVKHNNIVTLLDGGEGVLARHENGKKSIVQYLVLELIKYGELFDYIFFPQKGFGEEIGKYIFHQLLDGLESCHKAGIVHRDMKTENIMLDEGWIMKLADFGFATKSEGKKGNGLLYTALGTASYASPELLQKKPYLGVQSDIFSLGVSLFVLVTGKMPFKHALVDDPYYKEIVKLNFERYWEKLSSKVPPVSNEFKQLFVMLIAYDPCSRPTIEEARSHKWSKDFKPNKDEIHNEFKARSKIVQHKKELERKKEEEQERQKLLLAQQQLNNKFTVYKSESEVVDGIDNNEKLNNNKNTNIDLLKKTPDNLEIEDAIEFEDDEEEGTYILNPYCIKFKEEFQPGSLFDFIKFRLESNKKLEVKVEEDSYKIRVGCKPSDDIEENVELGGDFIIDAVEAEIDIKRRSDDSLEIELERIVGNKYDFHRLFIEIENNLS